MEETTQAIYKSWFADYEFPDENEKTYKSNGGEMVWNEELQKEIPNLTTKGNEVVVQLQQWITAKFGITLAMQVDWLRQTANNLSNRIGALLIGTVNLIAGLLFNLVIIPLFTALFF